MRILVINWQDIRNPLGGGAEVHLHEIFSRIARRGHDVTLLCSAFAGSAPAEEIDGISVVRRGGRELFNFRVPSLYRSLSRSGKFDIVVDDLNKIPFFTPLFVREPLAAIAHHLFDRSIFLQTNVVLGSYVYWSERCALSLYRRAGVPFMVVSPSTREEFVKRGYRPEDLPIIYNCVDHRLYRPTGVARHPTPLIGCFGRLKKYKSVDHLLLALPAVADAVPNVRAVIIGEGDDRPRLERIVRESGLAERVSLTGYVGDDRKVELLQQAWVNVATSSKEGWGLTVLEANACGTPVIASDVPGLRDSIRDGETGLLYTYGDVNGLAQSLIRVLRDGELRARLAGNALQWAGQFDWEVVAEQTLDLLRRRIAGTWGISASSGA